MNTESYYLCQISTASISFFASSVLAGGMISSGGGLSSAYRRIVFGITLSDLFQSLSIMVGPFAVPATTPTAPWAIGNTHSCRFDGFLFVFSGWCTPLYMLGLCLYTAFKITNRTVVNGIISRNIEKATHFTAWFFSLAITLVALGTNTINSSVVGSVCTIAAYPTGCRQFPQFFGECDSDLEKYVPTLVLVVSVILPMFCLFGIVVSMVIVCRHALRSSIFSGVTRRSGPPRPSRLRPRLSSSSSGQSSASFAASNPLPQEVQAISKLSGETPPGLHNGAAVDGINTDDKEPLHHELVRRGSGMHKSSAAQFKSKLEANEPDDETAPSFPDMTDNASYLGLRRSMERPKLEQAKLSQRDNEERNYSDIAADVQKPMIIDDQISIENGIQQGHDDLYAQDTETLVRICRREIILTSFYFVAAFLLTFVPWWFVQIYFSISLKSPPQISLIVAHIMYPLGGLWNVLAFTRPKIGRIVIENPGYSRWKAFWHVIKTGGDDQMKDHGKSNEGVAIGERNFLGNREKRSTAFRAVEAAGQVSSNFGRLTLSSGTFGPDNIAYRGKEQWIHYVGNDAYAKEESLPIGGADVSFDMNGMEESNTDEVDINEAHAKEDVELGNSFIQDQNLDDPPRNEASLIDSAFDSLDLISREESNVDNVHNVDCVDLAYRRAIERIQRLKNDKV